ncbi:MAG TPA: hypothetical protein VEO01_24195 [Pseudonocardiaceae bacterium]|nr:hypothetical protein [Pseudonocardiaceae bacterium]
MTVSPDAKHPPLDFPCVELAGQWSTSWLEFFEGEQGEPVWSVTLGSARDNSNIYVKTMPRDRYDRLMAVGSNDTVRAVIEDAAQSLINYALASGAAGPRESGARERLSNHVPVLLDELSDRYRDASQVEWLIDGGRVPFLLFSFGGWWAAYSGQLADRYVICHGNDPLPDDLTLSTVREIGAYASGLDVPFDLAVLQSPDQVARRVSHRVDLSLHTDYERLLETI